MLSRAILAVLALAPIAHGAPVPKPPRLSEDLLGGAVWHFEYGPARGGRIAFDTSGTYVAQHDPSGNIFWLGTWCVEGERLVLFEYSFNADTGTLSYAPTRCEYTLSTRDWPRLVGTTQRGVPVILSDPRR